jgi:hypothetical protein
MATTLQTIRNQDQTITYALLVVFTVDARSDEHLQDQQAIRDEATSWIESLDATVQGVCVRAAE